MQEFIDISTSLPTLIYSLPLSLMLVYWLFVIVGGIDLDTDGLDGAFEGVDGALDGADGVLDGVDGVLDGVDGALDGVDGALDSMEGVGDAMDAEIDVEADFDGSDVIAVNGPMFWLASALRLGRVPLTVVVSLVCLGGWSASYLMTLATRSLGFAVGDGVSGLLLAAAALPVGILSANLGARPLEPVFRVSTARRRSSLVGESCTVTTGRVSEGFGQASLMVGGDDLVIQVRCDAEEHGLSRGEEALIVSFDEEREAYIVEALTVAPSASARESLAPRSRPTGQASDV